MDRGTINLSTPAGGCEKNARMERLQQKDKDLLELLQAINPNLPNIVLTKLNPMLTRGYQLWMLEGIIIRTLPLLLEEIENMSSKSNQ